MEERELVRKYEPVLRFAKGENFFPMDVRDYMPHCSLHVMEAGRGVMRIPPPYVDLKTLDEFHSSDHYLVYAARRVANEQEEAALREWIERQKTVKGPDFRQFLKGVKEKLVDIGIDLAKIFLPLEMSVEVFECALKNYGGIGKHPPVYYYRFMRGHHDYDVIQYWFFYAYNDFATSHDGANDHEADWECIHLFLKGGEPVWTTYSSHLGHGRELGRQWAPGQMEFEGDHPVVYVGAGSHASYHTPDPHPPDKAFVAGDVTIGASSKWAWAEPEPLEYPWFTEFQGRWGACPRETVGEVVVGMLGGAPTGPKFDRNGKIRHGSF